MADDRELVRDRIGGRHVEVLRALRIAVVAKRGAGVLVDPVPARRLLPVETEIVADGVGVLGRNPLPTAANVQLLIVEFLAQELSVWVPVVEVSEVKAEV